LPDLVLDCSVTVAWFIPDERRVTIDGLLTRTIENGALVPIFWPIEVANALLFAMRARRVTVGEREAAFDQLARLQISADGLTIEKAWNDTTALADRFRLTIYDASYLELAARHNLPLATLDKDLRAAARKLGVELLG
jgi:predicted nucleic acid-binding protein